MIDKRIMYAQGQRVAKTLDGSRPGYRGSDYGDQARGTGAYSGGPPGNTGGGSTDRSRTTPTQDYNTAVATGENPLGIDMSKGPPNLTAKEIEFNALNFAPTKKGPSLLDIALFAAGPFGLLGKKAKTAAQLFGAAKRTNNLVNTISNTFGFENPIANLFSGNNKSTSKNNTTTNNGGDGDTNNGGDGDGIASLQNQTASYDEYILLLQKLQSGNINDSERNRFYVLKNMLGI